MQEGLTLPDLRRRLQAMQPERLKLVGIPNARVERDVLAAQLVSTPNELETVGSLRKALREQLRVGVDPEELRSLVQELGYAVAIGWSDSGSEGRYDVELSRDEKAGRWLGAVSPSVSGVRPRPWNHYANNPLQGKFTQRLVPALREYLSKQLPEYMVPSTFVLVDQLPLTASGKVDRRKLPPPDQARPETIETYVAPRTTIEERLVKAWGEVLGFTRIGVHDNFFSDLGGHSLLATRLVSRIRDSFGIDLPLRTIFDRPTIAGLGQVVELIRDRGEEREGPSIARLSREQHRVSLPQPGQLARAELQRGNSKAKPARSGGTAKVIIDSN